MVSIAALWLPILVATVLVFVASNLVWTVLPFHKSDTRRLPDEAATVEVLAKQGLKPGQYNFPWAGSMAEMKDPAYLKKLEGPVGILTVRPSGPIDMGKFLGSWAVYVLVMGVFVAYLAGRTLAPGTHDLAVFRVAGTAAFLGYSGAQVPAAIWWGKPWGNALREIVDGLVYALLTAFAFGWLWPR
jgi:hypothetical protein